MSEKTTSLSASRREPNGSRGARRLRREGQVPGTVYGGGKDPASFQIEARTLRNALASTGAVIDLSLDGEKAEPVVLKERARHPVSGETMHVDLLRVDLDKPIQQPVPLELLDIEDSDVKVGGILENTVRELVVEAVPTSIPDVIQHSVAGLKVGASVTLGEIQAPAGTTIIGDPELVIATIRTSRGMVASEAASVVELETEVIGEEVAGVEDDAHASDSADQDQ